MTHENTCADCGDSGWFIVREPDGHEVARECANCRAARLLRQSGGVPARYRDLTWREWSPVRPLAAQVKALRSWGGDPWSMALMSDTPNFGSGKTRALCATVLMWRSAGKAAYYLPVDRLMAAQGSCLDDEYADPIGSLRWACIYRGLLALDDVGAEHGDKRGWAASLVETVCDARYREVLPTLVATNLSRSDFQAEFPRAMRRLGEGLMLNWAAPPFPVERS